MNLGIFAINYATCADPSAAVRVARHAEAAGLESVWAGEHLVLPDPAPQGTPFDPHLPFLDPRLALSWVAAHTERIRLATGVLILPQHEPVLLAKQLASLDVLSGGRLLVGIGTGYIPAGFAATGVPLAERGARTDESLQVLRELWTAEHPVHSGEFTTLAGVQAQPRPVQAGGPPIIVGGASAPARRRALAWGNGWYVFNVDADVVREAMRLIGQETDQCERPERLGPLEVTITARMPLDRRSYEAYVDAGVDRVVLLPGGARTADRHAPVPVEDILRTIDDAVAVATAS